MERNTKILLVIGIGIIIVLLFINIYLAGIASIFFITFLMSLLIMQDARGIPDIDVSFREDAKGIILTNTGNARAEKIHVVLVPGKTEFDAPSLDPDSTYEFLLEKMIEQIKVVITYSNENGRQFSGTSMLSVFAEEPDLLKPMIPVFKWKK